MAKFRINYGTSTKDLLADTSHSQSLPPFKIDSWKSRLDLSERFGKAGTNYGGDEQPKVRYATFSWKSSFTTDAEYMDFVNEYVGIFYDYGYSFYLEDTENDRRCEIRLDEFDPGNSEQGTEYRVHAMKLKLVMLDSGWEDLAANTDSRTVTNEDTWNLPNLGYMKSYPVFTITAVDNITSFTIRNNTIGAAISINNSSFVSGRELIIDCAAGTIMMEGVDISTSLSSGGFLFMERGANEFKWESSGDVDIVTVYRDRYPF